MANPTRTFTGVQYEGLRAQIDPIFNAMHDELEDCYYGPKDADGRFIPGTGWRNGESRIWLGQPQYDVQATPALSKALFDRLQGALWTVYTVYLADENDRRGKPYPSLDNVNEDVPPNQRQTARQEAKRILRQFASEGFDLAAFKLALQARGIVFSEVA